MEERVRKRERQKGMSSPRDVCWERPLERQHEEQLSSARHRTTIAHYDAAAHREVSRRFAEGSASLATRRRWSSSEPQRAA